MDTTDNDSNEGSVDFEVIKLLYERASNDWRHFDNNVWQIPSLALAINTFMLSVVFNSDLTNASNASSAIWIRSLIISLATFFTIVLLIALVKHRLHQCGKDKNLEILEKLLPLQTKRYETKDKDVVKLLEPDAYEPTGWIVGVVAPFKAHNFLALVMVFTIVMDIVMFIGIITGNW